MVLPVVQKYGIEKVTLFGSYARGDAKAESDIDLLIECDKIRNREDYLGLQEGLKEETHRKLCDKALVRGFLTILPVVLMSAIFTGFIALTDVKTANPLLYQALYTFIVLALSEEIGKFWMTRRFMKKQDGLYSWLDVTILFTIVGTGFGILEIVIVPLLLAIADIVLAVVLIVFTRKARKREKYTTPNILA